LIIVAYPDKLYLPIKKHEDLMTLIKQCGQANAKYLMELFEKPPVGPDEAPSKRKRKSGDRPPTIEPVDQVEMVYDDFGDDEDAMSEESIIL